MAKPDFNPEELLEKLSPKRSPSKFPPRRLLCSVVAVLAPLGGKKVRYSKAVVNHFAIDEHSFMIRFLLAHGSTETALA
jgi:hypothetical protein